MTLNVNSLFWREHSIIANSEWSRIKARIRGEKVLSTEVEVQMSASSCWCLTGKVLINVQDTLTQAPQLLLHKCNILDLVVIEESEWTGHNEQISPGWFVSHFMPSVANYWATSVLVFDSWLKGNVVSPLHSCRALLQVLQKNVHTMALTSRAHVKGVS